MLCLHPSCPSGGGLSTWNDVLRDVRLRARNVDMVSTLAALLTLPPFSVTPTGVSTSIFPNKALLERLLQFCPCLYNQVDTPCSPNGVVHFCENTLGARIISANVHAAFLVQHPSSTTYLYPPVCQCTNGGDVMEKLCSEVLTNEGIPLMELDGTKWPIWSLPGHISLNYGRMREVKAFGDILIPAAPTNIIISVKSEAARERLLYSANMIEGIGFGFFNQPSEFWTELRMNLFKRMGFTAIYLPDAVHTVLMSTINANGLSRISVNINGRPLYRPLSQFGSDMRSIVGKTTLHL